jgi:hypothetical protein
LALQVIAPNKKEFGTIAVVTAGAYEKVLRDWIAARMPDIGDAMPAAPFGAIDKMLQAAVTFATEPIGASGAAAQVGGASAAPGGGRRGDGGLSRALDQTTLPALKSDIGHGLRYLGPVRAGYAAHHASRCFGGQIRDP